jgi:hypothetical protein
MKIPALFLTLNALLLKTLAADPAPSQSLFKADPIKLRSLPTESLYIQTIQTSFDLSTEGVVKKLEADLSRFKAMNGRDLFESAPKSDPPTRAQRLFNTLLPRGGAILGKNPNAPPSRFTR